MQLRHSFLGLETSLSIEREATKSIRDAYTNISFNDDSASGLFTKLPDYYRITAWLSGMEDVDECFRLHEGRDISVTLGWLDHASAGTPRGRENPITLDGKHNATWRDFSSISSKPGGQFRFLAWQIS